VSEQSDIDALSPSEARHRFRLALRCFTSTITDCGRPLVLFPDDLQWADPASTAGNTAQGIGIELYGISKGEEQLNAI